MGYHMGIAAVGSNYFGMMCLPNIASISLQSVPVTPTNPYATLMKYSLIAFFIGYIMCSYRSFSCEAVRMTSCIIVDDLMSDGYCFTSD